MIVSHLVSWPTNMERRRALSILVQGQKLEKGQIQHSTVYPSSLDTEGHSIRTEQACPTSNRIS